MSCPLGEARGTGVHMLAAKSNYKLPGVIEDSWGVLGAVPLAAEDIDLVGYGRRARWKYSLPNTLTELQSNRRQ